MASLSLARLNKHVVILFKLAFLVTVYRQIALILNHRNMSR